MTPCRDTIRAVLALFSFEGCDFYHNKPNDYGCITGKLWTGPGDPWRYAGEEETAEFSDGKIRGTGCYGLNEHAVDLVEKLLKEQT